MPPLPSLRVSVLHRLAEELRFAPRDALLRDLARAEALASDLDASLSYPEEWIVFRITGYRPDLDEPATIVGEALQSDLSALIERLSDAAKLGDGELDDECLTPEALLERWGVSAKTLSRYRRRGLVARRVRGADGRVRLSYPLGFVRAFEQAHGDLLARAGSFSRMDVDTEAAIVEEARRRHERSGASLSSVARQLAAEHGRSHEAVRLLLLRKEKDDPIFAHRGPLDARRAALAERSLRRGLEPVVVALHVGKPAAAVTRAALQVRIDSLRALKLDLWDGAEPDATAFEDERVFHGLGGPGPRTLRGVLELGAAHVPVDARSERAWARARRHALASAWSEIGSLDRSAPDAPAVDRAETALRAVARLDAELVRAQLPGVLQTLEAAMGGALVRLRAEDTDRLLRAALAATAEAVGRFDPSRGGRLAAPVGLSVQRLASRWSKANASGGAARASTMISATRPFPDFTRTLHTWQRWLEPPFDWIDARDRLAEEDQRLLGVRYGLGIGVGEGSGGGLPATLEGIAAARGSEPMHLARRLRAAVRRARAAGRSTLGA